MKDCYTKTIKLGKINFYGTRKINLVEITFTLRKENERYIYSSSADVWNNLKTDIVAGGQCFERIYKYLKHNRLFLDLYGLWKRNHLNDLCAGTPEQEKLLLNFKGDYDERRKYLESKNLLFDNGYEYGTKWLYREISKEDIEKIIKIYENE